MSAATSAFFLDIDGTLAELAPSPEAARVAGAARERIALLYRRSGGALALVTGRALRDVDRLLGAEYPAAGQHGVERRAAHGRVVEYADAPRLIAAVRAPIARIAHRAGVVVEDKGGAIAVHYRSRPRIGGALHRAIRREVRAARADLSVRSGKHVVEIVPAACDKGLAVAAFLDEPPFAGRRPVFVGDDAGDEPAFALVNSRRGRSVKVGGGPTVAHWRLADVRAVLDWLEACT